VSRHPCHSCPQRPEHERWQERHDQLDGEAASLRRRIDRQTGSLVRQLHRILAVLERLGYVDATRAPTTDGMRLARIYADADLVVAECLRTGSLDGLDPAEVAGMCALFTYEARFDTDLHRLTYPTERLSRAVDRALDTSDRLRGIERDGGLSTLRQLDPSFVEGAWRWARGEHLDAAIGSLDMTGGDFVRSIKQAADLAGQLRDAGSPNLADAAGESVDRLRRGVVAA
jgi:ATP-dependent RNA helicase HelY